MPELPEAETIVRALAPRVQGRRILRAAWPGPRVHRGAPPQIEGRTIRQVRRYGKAVLFELDRGVLLVRLGMTGKLLWGGRRGPYTRAVLTLENGKIFFDDVRQFGWMRWSEHPPDDFGPDPLDIGAEDFRLRLARHRTKIKALLLNQRFVRGVGNIYADEMLHRAGIHPLAAAPKLSRRRALRLHAAMVEVLGEAIARGGSSISDYLDPQGRKGMFQLLHRVYRRQGQPCPACGTTIRRIVVAQRGTHFCPRCQRT